MRTDSAFSYAACAIMCRAANWRQAWATATTRKRTARHRISGTRPTAVQRPLGRAATRRTRMPRTYPRSPGTRIQRRLLPRRRLRSPGSRPPAPLVTTFRRRIRAGGPNPSPRGARGRCRRGHRLRGSRHPSPRLRSSHGSPSHRLRSSPGSQIHHSSPGSPYLRPRRPGRPTHLSRTRASTWPPPT